MIDRYLQMLEVDLGARYSPDSKRTFLVQAKVFLKRVGAKESYTREDILGYVDSMIEQGKAGGTIHTALSAVRHLFQAIKCPWPLRPRELHLGLPRSQGGPALAPDEVEALIKGVRAQVVRFTPSDPHKFRSAYMARVAVALSTTYGLRPIELQRALSHGCTGETFELQTAKGGKYRQHSIPPEELRIPLTFISTKIGRATLHKVFTDLMKAHVRPRRKGEGWHAVRRSLVTGLLAAGLQMHTVSRWMGWQLTETAFSYYRPSQDDLDQTIFEKHPFLEHWR